ncbi:MAG TPA: transporter substrate-binding domain-containing protein [Rectinemataceae bacterium]|nr:transporter substrate-binding domain-containing protein [Rectinemataceae bacterium]
MKSKILTAAVLLFAIAASGNKLFAQASKTPAAGKDEVIVVGLEGAYPPYNFIEKDGTVSGYDADVIRAIDERTDGFAFHFEPTAWDAIFVALESGKFDIIANQISKNKAREEKYLFSESPYLYGYGAIIFKKGRTDIKTIADLEGKTVAAGVGSYNTSWLENYNATHSNKVKIQYYDGNVALMFADVASGRVDATLNDPITTGLFIKNQNLPLDYALRTDRDATPVYLLFSRNEKGARDKKLVDKALASLIADGSLSKISVKWFGKDFTTNKAAAK